MVGIVGAGGIGGTLFAAFQRFDYDFVLRDPARHHRHDHGGRGARDLGAQACSSSAARSTRNDAALDHVSDWRRFTPAQRLARFAFYLASSPPSWSRLRTSRSSRSSSTTRRSRCGDLFSAHVADRLVATIRRRARRAHRDAAHRHARARSSRSSWRAGRLPRRPQRRRRSRRSTSSPSSCSCPRRSVNSLVWALLFVAVFGPGALAGHARDRVPLDRLHRQALRRGARGVQPRHRSRR